MCLWLFLQILHNFSPCFSTAIGKDNDCFKTVVEQGNSEQWWRNVDGRCYHGNRGQRAFQVWESKWIFHHSQNTQLWFYSKLWAALVTLGWGTRVKTAFGPREMLHYGKGQSIKSSWANNKEIQTGAQVNVFSINSCYWILQWIP